MLPEAEADEFMSHLAEELFHSHVLPANSVDFLYAFRHYCRLTQPLSALFWYTLTIKLFPKNDSIDILRKFISALMHTADTNALCYCDRVLKLVDPDGELVRTARSLGVYFGDEP